MVPSNESITPAFVPSPPLSASSGPDCPSHVPELNDERRRAARILKPRLDSSPFSLTSNSSRSCAQQQQSGTSSFASEYKQEAALSKEEEEDQARAPYIAVSIEDEQGDLGTALRLVRASQQDLLDSESEWHELSISPAQFSSLRHQLREEGLLEYFEELRWDYSPTRSVLVLRLMATALHESLQDSLLYYIRTQLDKHTATIAGKDNAAVDGAQPSLAQTLAKIRSCGHAKVILGSQAKKSPDGQLRFGGRPDPPFVIEIGYSQKAESLQELAKEYYEQSDGEVKTVLTLNIDYSSPHQRASVAGQCDRTAVFCLYRGPKRVCKDVAFRGADGVPADGIQLRLSDFIPDDVLQHLSANLRRKVRATTINIPAQALCNFLAQADVDQKGEDGNVQKFEGPDETGPSKKRKSVHWDLDAAPDDQDAVASSRSSSASSKLRSKRRKTDLQYRPRSRSSQSAGTGAVGRGRTRSITRSDNEADDRPSRPRTRSVARSEEASS